MGYVECRPERAPDRVAMAAVPLSALQAVRPADSGTNGRAATATARGRYSASNSPYDSP